MADNSTISIIIPVYKAESTIGRCVDSILAQTYADWRLILVDDGSPDRSGELCDEYAAADPRIKTLHIPNGGAGNARNKGLDVCNTKWVTFVDADDSLEPGYLANFHLANHFRESDVVIMQGYRRVNANKEALGEEINLQNAEYSGSGAVDRAFSSDSVFEYGQVVGKLYDTTLIKHLGLKFTTEFQLSEDHLFYLTYLSAVDKIITYSGTLYNYIWEDGIIGLSRKKHPYNALLTRYFRLVAACDKLGTTQILSSHNIEKLSYFSVTGSVSLFLRSLYSQESQAAKRMPLLKRLLVDRERLRGQFKPNSVNGRVLRLILLYIPLVISDKLMAAVMKKL